MMNGLVLLKAFEMLDRREAYDDVGYIQKNLGFQNFKDNFSIKIAHSSVYLYALLKSVIKIRI